MSWNIAVADRRRNFSPATKRAIRERSGGTCEVHLVPRCMYRALPETCTRPGSEIDHITPDVFDGGNGLENGAFLCEPCHKIKTYTDNREAKKSNRIRGVTGNGPKKKIANGHRKMGSKPWPKATGPSRLSKASKQYQSAKAAGGSEDD